VLARALLVASLLQAALVHAPPLSWALWMLHFASLEACLLGCATGLGAFVLARGHRIVRALAVVGIVAGALPALAVVPAYRRERPVFSAWAWLTGRTGATVAVRRDLALAPGLRADLYPAPGPGPHPFVLVVHGGSWRSGEKGDAAHVSHALALAGVSVLDVSYRLAPAGRFPSAVADVKCLLGRARERAAELGLDPARAAILGRSAGGEIALVAAYSDDRIAPSCAVATAPVRAVVSVYGPSDLAWAHGHPFVPDVVRGVEAVEEYLGGAPRAVPEAYRLATPQTWITDATPPTLLVHGTGERCVRAENATMLAAALRARGRPVRALLVPMADHGFDVRPGGFGEQLARGAIVAFLRARLSPR
jgi:acetyl esterase/lipase